MTSRKAPVSETAGATGAGSLAEAESLARSRLREAPDDVEAMRILAAIAARTGHIADAERLLRSAIACQPQFVAAHADLASLLCATGRADDALALLDHEIIRNPGSIWPLSLKSAVLTAERREEDALPVHEQLVALAADASIPWMNYGYALKTVGRTEEAVAAYRRSLRLDPGNGAAWWGVANLRTIPLDAQDVRVMEQALPKIDDPFQRVQMLFALGKACADLGRFERSFACYQQANALRGTLVPYDPRTTRELVEAHEALAPAFFAGRRGCGEPADDPIFIVGMPRSGSTLVEQILASHPMVEGAGELFQLQQLATAVCGDKPWKALPAILAALRADELKALGRRYLESTRRHRRSGRRRFTDKMPANWQLIGLVQLILPNARIVAVRRDPVACCVSAFCTYFNRQHAFPADLHHLAQYHNDCSRMLDCIDTLLPGRVHHLRYERLVEEPESEIRRLLHYLGLDYDPSCLRFHETRRPVHTPSAQQVRLPINRSGLQRWRDYEPWLSPLLEGLASNY